MVTFFFAVPVGDVVPVETVELGKTLGDSDTGDTPAPTRNEIREVIDKYAWLSWEVPDAVCAITVTTVVEVAYRFVIS